MEKWLIRWAHNPKTQVRILLPPQKKLFKKLDNSNKGLTFARDLRCHTANLLNHKLLPYQRSGICFFTVYSSTDRTPAF
jgi:hypothetical protein